MPAQPDSPARPAAQEAPATPSQPAATPRPPGPRGTSAARPRRSPAGVWALLRRLHFYAGVFIAPFLAVAALTGLAYAFTPQLDQLVYPSHLRVADPGAAARPLAEQVDAARTAHPEGTIAMVVPAPRPDATTQVVLSVPELEAEEKQRTVYVDPYTGEVRGALTTWFGNTPMRTWFDDLHRNLHLGDVGRHYSELAASWLWVVVGGGLWLWLGRSRAYRSDRRLRGVLLPDRSAKGVRRTRGWHASLGVWLAVGLLFLSATGLTWSRYAGANFSAVLDGLQAHAPVIDATLPDQAADSPGQDSGHAGHDPGGAGGSADLPAGVAIDDVAASARAAGVDGPLEVTPPADDASGWVVAQVDDLWPVRHDQVAVDPHTGEIVTHLRWADFPLLATLTDLGIAAHMGLLFGLANQIALAAIAVGLLVMVSWGYRMWWQRRPTRGDRRAPLGAPPKRGAWRGLPLAVLVPGGLVVLAVGWTLPMLGVSLLCFLAVDLAVGIFQRRRPGQDATPPGPDHGVPASDAEQDRLASTPTE